MTDQTANNMAVDELLGALLPVAPPSGWVFATGAARTGWAHAVEADRAEPFTNT
jgi:hypothetical protein